jgi:hypothetical protein
VDVNIYAAGDKTLEKLRGNHENVEIAEFIREYMGLDLESVTEALNEGWEEGARGAETKVKDEMQFGRDYHRVGGIS